MYRTWRPAPQGCTAKYGKQQQVRHLAASSRPSRRGVAVRAEKREYYDYKDMPPLPLTVTRIYIPELDHVVVDKSTETNRMASLAIFYDIHKDDQYRSRLNRKSAITALCMYDRDDINEAQNSPGQFPNIDLLYRVYNQGLDVEFEVEELPPS
eukprot:CAMPEP_0202911274 /NCGR_PEP_ID=MMETSP1392-20130828/54491_2 /ASSEMBLY_ACC=CAM_ASM_000868 /TAXON_ID=225041 /ORGANISM="Chlamydomonas chlamydogama, Strain SAG 11-48b" /LENGTH=152 /DNA_ID= /DNA_START= /DNA_END= /DNA_ORIENTATION=